MTPASVSHELVEIPSSHRNVHSSSGGESGLDWYSQLPGYAMSKSFGRRTGARRCSMTCTVVKAGTRVARVPADSAVMALS